MFKPGQIWDRTHRSGKAQVGLLLSERDNFCRVFVISGYNGGEYSMWSVNAMREALRDGRLVQLA